MKLKITTLMENASPNSCLAAEHGLSLLLEGDGLRLLYDTGASPRFLLNARALDVDLGGLDALVFSHGHYDHTGGAAALLTRPDPPKAIYLGRQFFEERAAQESGGFLDISAPLDGETLGRLGVPCRVVGDEPVRLGDGVWLLSGFSPREEVERPSPKLLRRINGGFQVDRFPDETAVVVETANELALISGCSHTGILSMCLRVSELFGRPVTSFVGGTHLMAADDERIAATCRMLRERGMKRLGACHCSGERAGAYFQAHFPGYFPNHVGSVVTID